MAPHVLLVGQWPTGREALALPGQRGKKTHVTSVATAKVWSLLQCCRAVYGRGPGAQDQSMCTTSEALVG
jgi:hypothetical protein